MMIVPEAANVPPTVRLAPGYNQNANADWPLQHLQPICS
jgi:hypothetical protein